MDQREVKTYSPIGAASGSEILPFAPVIYLAWADGELSEDEIGTIRRRLDDAKLDDETRAGVGDWLDPASPPAPAALDGLLAAIRETAARQSGGMQAASTLAELGERLALAVGADVRRARQVRTALEDIEPALGVISAEALRALIPSGDDGESRRDVAAFDVAAMNALLDAGHRDIRGRLREILSAPEFAYGTTHDSAAYRQRVLDWCRTLAGEGIGAIAYPREFGGEHDAARSIAAFETIAYHDLSLLIKFGVQFGLFGGSIFLLGTRRHHERWLRAAGTLELPGCFAMTETGHGSNVRDIETTATFLPARDAFEVHTPNRGAMKDYIGNAALHGRVAVVFAQLESGGGRHGVHAFLVPIRDEAGNTLPGVRIEDCGLKEGLNGVDNGRLTFDHVRVPREHLLNRFGDVSEDGTYTSSIASPGRRFFTMLGTLVAGRIAIAAGALSATKSGLAIAVRYTARRRQFGPEGEAEVPVLDYRVVQRALLPRLATVYALDFAIDDLVSRFVARSDADAQEIEALAAGIKAYASRLAVETLQACREACGGQGYLEVNRLGILRADTDVFTTFEGANAVLWQLVAKGLLTEYREQFGELRLWNVVRYVSGRAAKAIAEQNPIAKRRTESEHLRDADFHSAAFRFRELRLTDSLARRLRRRISEGEDSFAALNACQDHAIAAATASIERHVHERLMESVAKAAEGLRPALDRVAALFALSTIERNAAWYLEKNYIEGVKAAAIREEVNRLCAEVRGEALSLVDAFGIPDALLAAPIGIGAGTR
jgi:acyl-CoA oxidase